MAAPVAVPAICRRWRRCVDVGDLLRPVPGLSVDMSWMGDIFPVTLGKGQLLIKRGPDVPTLRILLRHKVGICSERPPDPRRTRQDHILLPLHLHELVVNFPSHLTPTWSCSILPPTPHEIGWSPCAFFSVRRLLRENRAHEDGDEAHAPPKAQRCQFDVVVHLLLLDASCLAPRQRAPCRPALYVREDRERHKHPTDKNVEDEEADEDPRQRGS